MISALSLFTSAAVAVVAVLPLRRLALRLNILDRPGLHKSHVRPVPYLGGVAVLAGVGVGMLVFSPEHWSRWVLLLLIMALGLFDDVWQVSVTTKLVVETAMAMAAVAFGFVWNVTDSTALNIGLSLLWILAMTNAFNMIDNMDGLAATIAATSLAGLGLAVPSSRPLAFPLAGALAGFLVFNLPPARMFLGDAGSLPVGFGVALATITAAGTTRGLHSLVLLCFPVALAVFDISLVVVSRLATGRPVQLGGRDHFSHRLKLLGWSQRQILLFAATASATGVLIAILAVQYPIPEAWLAVPIAIAYGAAWLRLLRVDPYSARESKPEVWSA